MDFKIAETSGGQTVRVTRLRPGRYRVVGPTTSSEWVAALRPGREAWCEITIDPGNGGFVGAYGGEVWPTAWPELFQALPSSAQLGCARVGLTERGRLLFDESKWPPVQLPCPKCGHEKWLTPNQPGLCPCPPELGILAANLNVGKGN